MYSRGCIGVGTEINRFDYIKGAYRFLKPSETTYRDGFDTLGNPSHATFSLEDDSRYIVILVSTQSVAGNSPGLAFYVTFEMNIEFQTTDPWPESYQSNTSFLESTKTLFIFMM